MFNIIGSGYGDGSGSGYGDGCGYGLGYGSGDGAGSGCGDGDGSGTGKKLTSIDCPLTEQLIAAQTIWPGASPGQRRPGASFPPVTPPKPPAFYCEGNGMNELYETRYGKTNCGH